MVVFNCKKQRLRNKPFHNCTPIIPKIKKTKKQRRSALPSIGNVSSRSITSIRIDGTRLIVRNGRRTRTVRVADKLKLSPGINNSTNLNVNSLQFLITVNQASKLGQFLMARPGPERALSPNGPPGPNKF